MYHDGFQASRNTTNNQSLGGIYMLSDSFPEGFRRTASVVHPISLTPPWASTKDVLNEIVDDIISGTLHGFRSTNPFGDDVWIFLD